MLSRTDFFYELPSELIAQIPMAKRDESRLLVCHAQTKSIEDHSFADIPSVANKVFHLQENNSKVLFIVNNSRVYPARIRIKRKTGARGEVFLLETGEKEEYQCLLRPQNKLKVNEVLYSETDEMALFKVCQVNPPRVSIVSGQSWENLVKKYGEMPLPPYINRDPNKKETASSSVQNFLNADLDEERYQTIYSDLKLLGSAAAPTAGLHFTNEKIEECKKNSIEFAHVTLHVGLGTFSPVQTNNLSDHVMHEEYYSMPSQTLIKINEYLSHEWPIVFVGTTSLRSVESFFRQSSLSPLEIKNLAKSNQLVNHFQSFTDVWLPTKLFLYPKNKEDKITPQIGQAIMTNFHQPESTLAMMISALMGYEFWREFYTHAIENKYRFFSYGDSSLLIFDFEK